MMVLRDADIALLVIVRCCAPVIMVKVMHRVVMEMRMAVRLPSMLFIPEVVILGEVILGEVILGEVIPEVVILGEVPNGVTFWKVPNGVTFWKVLENLAHFK